LLQTLTKYSILGSKNISVNGISEDSRKIKSRYIFVAIKGLNYDGHEFINDAIKKGAIAILGERNIKPKTTYIKVKDSREALGKFSAAFYGNPAQKLKVIGITGTDGKTTTANLIYWILKTSGAKVGLVSTIGAKIGKKEIDTGLHVTNPDPVSLEKLLSEMLRANCSYGILEVTSHGLDQKRVAGVKFDAGVLTNITHEHIDYHKSFAKYIKVKAKLFQGVKYAILNKKDFSYPKIKSMIGAFKKTHDFQSGDELNAHMSSSGRRGNRGLKSAEDIIKSGVKIVDYPQKLSTKISEAIEKRFDEDYNRENAQAAIAVAKEYGVKDRVIVKAIKTFPNLPGRMEEIKNTEGIRVFVDFAHTPNALESALLALRKKTKGRIITVLGCAGERDKEKRPMMGEISARLSQISIFTAEDPRHENVNEIINEMAGGAKEYSEEIHSTSYSIDSNHRSKHLFIKIPDRNKAITYALQRFAKKGDVVGIFGKGHEKSMAFGDKEYPWSDQEAARTALNFKEVEIEKDLSFGELKKVHFTGIKGVGMTSLALCLDDLGIKVTGSDTKEEFVTDEILRKRKIKWKVGFSAKNLDQETDLVIVTGAHGGLNNPEAIAAKKLGIPVMTHAEALALVAQGKKTIAVSGVGGKTTVSSMIAQVLTYAGKHPSYAIGVGNIFPLNTPGKYKREGLHFICEADEFAVSPGVDDNPRFSFLFPSILIVTNIEHDHPDIYPTIEDTKITFKNFFEKVPKDGVLIACLDNQNIREVIMDLKIPMITYGFSKDADWRIADATFEKGRTKFSLLAKGNNFKDIILNVPGKYNVLNAVATLIVARKVGVSDIDAIKGIGSFKGSKRRFEFIGEENGVSIYDDYAHHPNEIKAVLEAARSWFPDRRIVALFQPHTYSRTKALFKDFAASFKLAHVTGLMDIYSSAREKVDTSISSEKLAEAARQFSQEVYYTGSHNNSLKWLKDTLKKGDVLITLGAGDIFHLHTKLLNG